MWILECDGDLFQHKRIWLRPGKKVLFGRTKSDKGGIAIESKSISRKHLTIEVAPVSPGDGSKVHIKSRLIVEDQKSKIGTQVDGEQIRGRSKLLSGDMHEIRLGSYQQLFRVKWQPVVFTFSFSSKEQKRGDPLIPIRARLEALDVKTVIPYINGQTTHVVASKRNTAKGLEALINAQYIVTDAFVDAVVEAATPEDPQNPESDSRLEADFDVAWPDALQYLPVQSKEPSQRPAKFFAPDKNRNNIFEGYTFVFCDQTQFDNLQAPINNGGGKALLFQLAPGETTPDEIVRYVKAVAGEEGTGEFEDGSEGKGVVVVRFRGRQEHESWSIEVGNEVARKLDQRLIEQSEFLDAILINDASTLRKPLPEEDDDAPAGKLLQSEDTNIGANDIGDDASKAEAPPGGRMRSRRLVTSRFKGFDDGFDTASLPPSSNLIDEDFKSQVSPEHDTGGDGLQVEPVGVAQTRSSRKRTHEPSEDEDEEEMFDEMLPAAAAMKRRRIEEEQTGHSNGANITLTRTSRQLAADSATSKSRRPKKEIDVRTAAREHREAAEEALRRDQETLQASLEGMDVEQMKNLAIVEDMSVKPRSDRPSRAEAYGDRGNRWDDRWNGRKNFKKFRRRGAEDSQIGRRGRGVIVGFAEVRRKDFGIGDEYWVESDRQRRRNERSREDQTSGESRSQPYTTARSQAASGDTEDPDMPRVVDGPPGKRIANKPTSQQASQDPRANPLASQIPSDLGKGGPPSSTVTSQGPTRKRKTYVRDSESDQSDDDGLKFRFKKKR